MNGLEFGGQRSRPKYFSIQEVNFALDIIMFCKIHFLFSVITQEQRSRWRSNFTELMTLILVVHLETVLIVENFCATCVTNPPFVIL